MNAYHNNKTSSTVKLRPKQFPKPLSTADYTHTDSFISRSAENSDNFSYDHNRLSHLSNRNGEH